MTDHRIRFRGSWDWLVVEDDAEIARRLTLPTRWPDGVAARFRLLRHFGRPPFNPALESVSLELLRVPGLVVARLNGREIARPTRGLGDCVIPLVEPLLARNALMLEVDLETSECHVPAEGWGSIALVIGPKGGSEG